MSFIKVPCPEPGCDKSFRQGAEVSRHMWSHIPRKFRPLCPGKKGGNGTNIPCCYRYNGRRDLWKSHWATQHRHDAYPSNYRFDDLKVCRMNYANSLLAPFLFADTDITSPINVGTASIPDFTLAGKDSHPLFALRTPVSADIQTQDPPFGLCGPAAADMSTFFHPSINFHFPTFYNQPGPSMPAIMKGLPQPAPIVGLPGFSPCPTGFEGAQDFQQEMPDGFSTLSLSNSPLDTC